MKLEELTGLMERSFEHHVDGLEAAVSFPGVTVMPSDKLRNTEIIMMVSPSAYEALEARARKKEQGDG